MTIRTNYVEVNGSFVGFPQELIGAMLVENPAADVACALDVGARDYFLLWKISRKET
jgi:hypothetical protein